MPVLSQTDRAGHERGYCDGNRRPAVARNAAHASLEATDVPAEAR